MISEELEDALEQSAQARIALTQAETEYNKAREEWEPFAQVDKEFEEIAAIYEELQNKRYETNKQFDAEHPQLVEAKNNAWEALRDTSRHLDEVTHKIIQELRKTNER